MKYLNWLLYFGAGVVVLMMAYSWHKEKVIDARVEWIETMHQAEMEMNKVELEAFLQSKTYQWMAYQKTRRSF